MVSSACKSPWPLGGPPRIGRREATLCFSYAEDTGDEMEGLHKVQMIDREAMPEVTSIYDERQTHVQQTNSPSNLLEKQNVRYARSG